MSKCFFAVAVLAGTFSTAALAGPVTDEESKYCAYNYRAILQSGRTRKSTASALHEGPRQRAFPECIKALEDAGEVTPEEKSELKKIGE